MEQQYSTQILRNYLVDIQMRRSSEGLVSGVAPDALSELSSLDSDQVEATIGGSWMHEGLDMNTVLRRGMIESAWEEEMKRVVMQNVFQAGEKVQKEIVKLLDEELQARGSTMQLPNKNNVQGELALKLAAVSRLRMKEGVKNIHAKKDVTICLVHLWDGWPDTPKHVNIHSPLGTSFPVFLNTLTDETQKCRIPPREPLRGDEEFPNYHWHTWPEDKFAKQDKEFDLKMKEHEMLKWGTDGDAATRSKCQPRNPDEKGYSLSDGAWMWRSSKNGKVDSKWGYITDEVSYMNMIDALKEKRQNFPRDKWGVFIMHSVDWGCRERHAFQRDRERLYNFEWAAEMTREGFLDPVSDADNEGESWFDYQRKQDTMEEREKRARNQENPNANSSSQLPLTPSSITRFSSSPSLPPTGSDPIYPSSPLSNPRSNPASSSPSLRRLDRPRD